MRSTGKRLTTAALLAVATTLGSVLFAAPASATGGPYCGDGGYTKRWLWERPGGNNIGQACYWDSGNRINVDDQEADDHSLVLRLRNPRTGVSWTYWNTTGASGPGQTGTVTQFPDNIIVEGQLCLGEWSETNPRVLERTCRAWSSVRL
ncbi:hypothetical protein SAMN05192558_103521 [Actinokineospora alba]|uniref:Uncharacterized protein n=1 Tax=Actinokineospora alba TaxID=504798 RepID=A0A1H0KKI5_9PSEU|nr:hypothetical protein [Actinokineospora alba]TDP67867.1 hypothetical protein C8E96_3421 [Actinokineospora alba]SDH87863.1 hypothetical protein SAMN05421871_102528 [Actinokineospora alba]SDO56405.1 hypothetical protein SAMN05192558_103521 [Actinokineospora alba]